MSRQRTIQSPGISFRDATLEDGALLLRWRNDELTRAQSNIVETVSRETHVAWLDKILKSDRHSLWIAIVEGEAIGTVRLDEDASRRVLSWTIAPEQRGRGLGRKMVHEALKRVAFPVYAEIKAGNVPSLSIAKAEGFELVEQRGILQIWTKGQPDDDP